MRALLSGAAFILAADPQSPLDPSSLSFWTSLGIAGVVMLAFAREWVVAGTVMRRAEQRAEQAEQALRDVTPAFTRHNDAVDKMLELIAEWERRPPKGRA